MKNYEISHIIAENEAREAAWMQRRAPAPCVDGAEPDMRRIERDFEYWARKCVKIKDKTTSQLVPFVLNYPQRRLLAELEALRLADKPIRIILLKARQWGGSTLVQVYMAWIQIVLKKNWNSIICGHLRDTASAIRGMYSQLLRDYPQEFCAEGEMPRFKAFERSANVSEITNRGCVVIAGTAQSQNSVRGYDIAMAHLTEVAFWPSTASKSPQDLVRSVSGSIMLKPLTVVVMESTANGMGNFFHNEYLRAKSHRSDKTAVFVPWYEIEIYSLPVAGEEAIANLLDEMDEYEDYLWQDLGLTLGMINWYHQKRREYNSHGQMKAEYPTTDVEAFANTGQPVFNEQHLERLRHDCAEPALYDISAAARTGVQALRGIRLDKNPRGTLMVWAHRCHAAHNFTNRYVVTVDVGGTSDASDWSVITVFDRHSPTHRPEVVAEWRGHIYHDYLAWLAAQIAKWYHNAHLVVESNTLESEFTEGDGSDFVLHEIGFHYKNMYCRETRRPGFHTNRKTKEIAIFNLICMVRDGAYTERNAAALTELACYEHKDRGAYGAIKGKHDDMVMTRAIGLKVISDLNRDQNLYPPVALSDCLP